MEVGRRSVGSNNDLPERRGKKTPWSLPLATLLSFNDRGVHPDCPNASNAFHKCGRHCVDKIPSRKIFVDALTSEEDGEKLSEKRGINPKCPNASNPFHKCAEYCFEKFPEKRQDAGKSQPAMKPKAEKKAGFTTDRLVKPKCKNASNPYHMCDEYCLENIPVRDQTGQVVLLQSSREVNKVFRNKESTGSTPQCKHTSKPYHESSALYFQSVPDSNLAEGENPGSISTDKANMHHNKQIFSSHHEITEYCFEDTFEKQQSGVVKPNEESEIIVIEEELVVNTECKSASKPSHEQAVMKSKEDNKVIAPLENRTNFQCKNASNPYHMCAEYCLQNVPKGHHLGQVLTKSKEEKEVVPSPQRVNSDCKYASNPYHVCAQYCFENVLGMDQPALMLSKKKERPVLPSEVALNLDCKFASNPYHACAAYCYENIPEKDRHRQVMKLKSFKELKNLVSNKKMTTGHPQCSLASNPYHKCAEFCTTKNMSKNNIPDEAMKTNVKKKESNHSLRRDVNPNCKHASNPFHRCPEYCSEGTRISPKNEEVDGNKDEATQHHPIKVKKSSNSGRIILQDRAEKSSLEDKHVDAWNPTNSNLCDETKDLQSEMKNLKEPRDVQPLQPVEVSDLFHEWAKYCSQKKVADDGDERVIQETIVELGELSTRNDNGTIFVNGYESAKLVKVQTIGGIPRTLPISLLFFLGFLFAMVYWTQVIHSLVMSSATNQGRERKKLEGDRERKCRNASEPYHICSDCCF